MSDDENNTFEISRRKTLAALGTIGAASAGAGLGTSAFLSDTENFTDNSLTAGTLDMVVDWEEHYYDGMGSEAELVRLAGPEEEPDFSLEAPADNPNAQPIELVFNEGVTQQQFWDATAIEAFPDSDQDAIRDPIADACGELGSLDDVLDSDLRTENEYTSPGDPLISLDDVKPGDFGEATLSFHLCENPGFVWFGGDLIRHVDGENTEPEIADPDEAQNATAIGSDTPGELAQQLQVRAWYDDCDNIYEPEVPASCVYHLVDNSGTMEQNLVLGDDDPYDKGAVATDLGSDLTTYLDTIDDAGDDGTLTDAPSSVSYIQDETFSKEVSVSTNETDVLDGFDTLPDTSSGGITAANVLAGLDDAQTEFTELCQNENKVVVFYTNADSRPGTEAERQEIYDKAAELKDSGVTIKVVGMDVDVESNAEEFLMTIADEYYTVQPAETTAEVEAQVTDVQDNLQANFEETQLGEAEIFRGTLEEFLSDYAFDPENGELGYPLEGDMPAGDGGGSAEARNCFSATETHCIGFEWWLPLDHANEIQGDIVEFDLGFYTEQCRHNDGTGLEPEINETTSNA